MRYIAYKGTRYEYKTTVPERKVFGGKRYELVDVFANYGSLRTQDGAVSC